jgi:cytochrome c oxidase subunit 2
MSASGNTTAVAGPAGPRHGLRIFLVWLVASAIVASVVYFVWGPHLPPGAMSSSAANQQFDNRVLGTVATPVILGVWIYFGYALIFWRRKDGDREDGPGELPGAVRVQASWIIITSVTVLSLFGFGTYELISAAGAGAGEGPAPIWKPDSANVLQVQVIAQQWRFTYRYPQFGGMETPQLVLPVGRAVEFHVTSLDVIHSFWAYQLGVKADANPNVDNVAYTTPEHTGGFTVRCAELCGIWHGAMYNSGSVVSVPSFQRWGKASEIKLASVTRQLPRYSLTYWPNEIKGLAKFFTAAGIYGSGGQYYGPAYAPVQP